MANRNEAIGVSVTILVFEFLKEFFLVAAGGFLGAYFEVVLNGQMRNQPVLGDALFVSMGFVAMSIVLNYLLKFMKRGTKDLVP